MAGLLQIDDIPAFKEVRGVPLHEVTEELRSAVRRLHEADDIEEFIRAILSDRAATPHGPAEIVDILTHRIQIEGSEGLAAFVLKGRSFETVRPKDVSHQIYRLEKIDDLSIAIFAATGIVLDAVKEQFSSTAKRLGVSYCIWDVDDLARLFWAYGFLCPRDGTRIKGGRCHCGYAPQHSVLNILQEETLSELKRARELGQTKALVVLPPGTGKTRIAARDSKHAGANSVLYIAHTNEILDVAKAEFSAVFGTKNVENLSNLEGKKSQVTLATVQYMANHIAAMKLRNFDYLVVDEFHHAAAPTYRRIVAEIDDAFLLGLTATPFRADRQDIAKLCNGNIVVQYEMRSGIDIGILTPYYYFGCFDDVDYGGLPAQAGAYTVRDLERKLVIKERHVAIVDKWLERAEGKATLAFCCSHKHAEKVAAEFTKRGIPSDTYIASTDPTKRKRLVEQLRTGKLKVLCVVDVLNEGVDVPFVECLMFLRPTESKRIFLQQLGRGLRRYVGKSHCIVIDFIGNFRNAYRIVEYHGLRAYDVEHRPEGPTTVRTGRELLDIPIGCKVTFEDRVLNIFADQTLDPKNATRENIGRILLHRYRRLSDKLGRPATKRDVDRLELLDSSFYKRIFGSWDKFMALYQAGN